MYRLRLILMIALSVGLVGAAAALSLGGSRRPEQQKDDSRKLLQRLADSDPDVRREAEEGLRKLDRQALPALREAVGSRDEDLAKRARRLLEEMEGGTAAKPAPQGPPVEIMLQVPSMQIAAGEPLRFYAQLRNNGRQPVLVARHKGRFGPLYRRFARLEVSPADGDPFSVSTELRPEGDGDLEILAIPPGMTVNLYPVDAEIAAGPDSWLRRPGEYRLCFVYDATDAYLRAVGHVAVAGSPMPAGQIASNAVMIVVR